MQVVQILMVFAVIAGHTSSAKSWTDTIYNYFYPSTALTLSEPNQEFLFEFSYEPPTNCGREIDTDYLRIRSHLLHRLCVTCVNWELNVRIYVPCTDNCYNNPILMECAKHLYNKDEALKYILIMFELHNFEGIEAVMSANAFMRLKPKNITQLINELYK